MVKEGGRKEGERKIQEEGDIRKKEEKEGVGKESGGKENERGGRWNGG